MNRFNLTHYGYSDAIIFIETTLFTRKRSQYLTEDEYFNLQNYLIEKPDIGKVIQLKQMLERW